MRSLIQGIKEQTTLRYRKIHKFNSKISFYIEFGPYILKTAETKQELINCFRLRHEVFWGEYRNVNKKNGLDIDQFDHAFDHLMILLKDTHEMVGTYRLNLTADLDRSYTGTEFDLHDLSALRLTFLELGRACIHKNHRRGAVISLLWRGIAEYLNLSEAQVLFGCSSVPGDDYQKMARLYKALVQEGHAHTYPLATPRAGYFIKDFKQELSQIPGVLDSEELEIALESLPPLLKSYLKMGARIIAEPAYDAEFRCFDLLTMLRKEDLPAAVAKRFQVQG